MLIYSVLLDISDEECYEKSQNSCVSVCGASNFILDI